MGTLPRRRSRLRYRTCARCLEIGMDAAPQILSRLAAYFDLVCIGSAEDWREHWLPGRPRFAEAGPLAEIAPAFSVVTSGCRWPKVMGPAWLRTSLTKGRLRAARHYLYLARRPTDCSLPMATGVGAGDRSCRARRKPLPHSRQVQFSDVELPNRGQETELIAGSIR